MVSFTDTVIGDPNPFVYSRPLDPEDVINRDQETRELLEAAVGGHFVRLYAPRKFGKTSLLGRALADGERTEGMIPVHVDFYGALSLADVTVRIERAYAEQLKGKLRASVEAFLQRTGLGLSLGAFGIGAKLQLEPKVNPLPALHALLDLPLRLEEGGGFRAFVVFDEFQDVGKVPGLDALLRTHIQLQGKVASYVFAGSEPGLMRELFETKEKPLYGAAVPVPLGRLHDEDIATYVSERFRASKRGVGEALNPLIQTARGHPQRAMLLAHRLWAETARGEDATLDHWQRALARALAELEPEFDAHWRRLEASEQRTLRAVVTGDGSPYQAQVLDRLGLTKSAARGALERLRARAEVEASEDGYRLIDPLFAVWAARLRAEPPFTSPLP